MPIIVQSTDTTGAGITLTADDHFFLLEGKTIVADTGIGDGIIGGSSDDYIDITIAGTIIADNSAVDVRGDNITVTLTETATVFGSAPTASFGVLSFEGTEVDVTNHGLISSPDMIGVFLGDPDSTIHNTGIISGSSGVLLYGADSSIVNSGSILGAKNRALTTPFEGSSIYIRASGSSLTNLEGGVISTTDLSGSAVYYDGSANGAMLDNYGMITSSGIGIEIEVSGSNALDIANYGVISGGVAAIQASSTIENVINGGIINGDVNLGGYGDSVRNTGQINGNVDLGTGDDLYNGNGGGTVSGTISGGAGADTIIGVAQSDVIDGGADFDVVYARSDVLDITNVEQIILEGDGNHAVAGSGGAEEIIGNIGRNHVEGGGGDDTIEGRGGNDLLFGNEGDDVIDGGAGDDNIRGGEDGDEIFGGDGEDTLRGEDGADDIRAGFGEDVLAGNDGDDTMRGGEDDDRLYGGGGDDILAGNDGNDVLDGNVGDDTLFGGRGDDTLLGGDGQDALSGDTGADVFVFETVDHSPHGGATRDTIIDFESGLDRIDLSGFAGTLTFVGADYTGAGNEVRYNDSVGRLYIDVDGDSVSEFSVDLTGAPALDAGDLIL